MLLAPPPTPLEVQGAEPFTISVRCHPSPTMHAWVAGCTTDADRMNVASLAIEVCVC